MPIHIHPRIVNITGSLLLLAMLTNTSCKKFITLGEPETSLGEKATFTKEATATAALLDAYSGIISIYGGTSTTANATLVNAMYADEYTLTNTDPGLMQLHTNSLDANNGNVRLLWNNTFATIYKVNAVMENIEKYGVAIPEQRKAQLQGEARFLRAFCYLHLVNIFGDVPVLLTSDYRQNRHMPKTPRAQVYTQVVQDLKDAQTMLQADYLTDANLPGTARLRPNKDAATALLARVYLYMEMWEEAKTAATTLINKTAVYGLETDLTRVFNINSREAIFQLPPGSGVVNPSLVGLFRLTGAPTTTGAGSAIGMISTRLLNSFEAGDKRRSDAWVGTSTSGGNTYYFPHKYKSNSALTQYLTSIRLAEMYLVRAEAYIQQENIADGIADLNTLRRRARAVATTQVPNPLPDLSLTLTKREALLSLEQERKIELFTEGHRWYDLKRWKGFNNPAVSRADELMPAITAAKGGSWEVYKKLFPFPLNETLLNTNLKQNDQYEQ
ncbi:RagB/SusD family nutrient uptake outer membrane protein [Chitinophaga horti]|uniref:RagB/SusD family nutrient uptake outer membrane protein n=1 Tax=Chitinophaga horti TaxID=2920382 RepID=A0ABY6IUB8_9BACT|nr:RagB/SusD family nutrient uptake outer membrane protein [Chitinophaga horti]UYQ90968.1 RagB/SusD family nutrient uptake outer membrane protein [Chitinophaga horti]